MEVNGVDYIIHRTGELKVRTNRKTGQVTKLCPVSVKFYAEENGELIDLSGAARRNTQYGSGTNEEIRSILGSFDDFILTSYLCLNILIIFSILSMALYTLLPRNALSLSLNSTASLDPVEAPLGTEARPIIPSFKCTSTSTVGLPLESRICLDLIFVIMLNLASCLICHVRLI